MTKYLPFLSSVFSLGIFLIGCGESSTSRTVNGSASLSRNVFRIQNATAEDLRTSLGRCYDPFNTSGGNVDLNSGWTVYSGVVKGSYTDIIDRFGDVFFQPGGLQTFKKNDGSITIKESFGAGFEPASKVGNFLRSLVIGKYICFGREGRYYSDKIKVYFSEVPVDLSVPSKVQ